MIRLIIKEVASDPDGKTRRTIKTFDVDLPEVETYLKTHVGYYGSGSREIIGAELIKNKESTDEL